MFKRCKAERIRVEGRKVLETDAAKGAILTEDTGDMSPIHFLIQSCFLSAQMLPSRVLKTPSQLQLCSAKFLHCCRYRFKMEQMININVMGLVEVYLLWMGGKYSYNSFVLNSQKRISALCLWSETFWVFWFHCARREIFLELDL